MADSIAFRGRGFRRQSRRYVPPTVVSVTPSTAVGSIPTAVTVMGTNFVPGVSVKFNGVPATDVVRVSLTTITCTTPVGGVGTAIVSVINPDSQQATLINGFTFINAAPVVTSLTPANGPASITAVITINGTDFLDGATAQFGIGATAVGTTWNSSTSLTCTTPIHAAETVDVRVVNTDGQFDDLAAAYTFDPAPTIASVAGITPSTGFAVAQTPIVIAGTNFINGATVTVGGVDATDVVWNSAIEMTCTTPTGADGAAVVVVMNPDGQVGTSVFTYNAAPTVVSMHPNIGFAGFTTGVGITGTFFDATPTVTFDGVPATGVVYTSSTSIQCTAPSHVVGAVDVVVTNPDTQDSGATGNGVFTYEAAPVITSVSQRWGSTSGGTGLTITGTDFVATPTVKIGGTSCNNVVRNSSTELTCVTAAKGFGVYDIVVTNPDTQSSTLVGGFSHFKEMDFTSSSFTPGSQVNATFQAATGLSSFSRADTTVVGSSTTVQTSASTLQSGIGANLPRIYFDGTHRGFLIEHAVNNQIPGNVRTGNVGWTASGQGTQLINQATGPDGTVNSATRLSMSSVNNISNYYDRGAETAFLLTFSTWQKSASGALTDMQQCIQANIPATGNTTNRAGSSSWGRLVTQKTSTLRRYFWACDTYDRTTSGQTGQTARGRDVYADLYQLEYGDFATSNITTATATRAQDRATWTMPFSNSRARFYASFKPLFTSVSGTYTTAGVLPTTWPIFTYDAKNDLTINPTTKILTIKVDNVSLASVTPLAWAAYDNVELFVNYGNNVTSSVAWRVNSGSWTTLAFSNVTGSAIPPTTSHTLFAGLSSNENTLPCVVQKLRAYPIDITTSNL